jgi:hypothetical protein
MMRALKGAVASVLTVCAAASGASGAVGIDEVLRTARHAHPFQAAEQKAAQIAGSGGNTPLIDNIQFQAALQEKPNPEQKYSVRLSPRAPGETAAQGRLLESLENRERAEARLTLLQELRARYDAVTQLKILGDRKTALQALHQVHQAMAGWARKSVQANPPQVKTLLDADSRVDETQLKLSAVESELESVRLRIAGFFASAKGAPEQVHDLALSDFPPPAQLQEIGIQAAEGASDTSRNIHLSYAAERSREALSDYETDRAKSHRYFKFVDVGVENKKKEQSVFLELGFSLPFIRADRVSNTQKLSKALSEENQLQRQRFELAEQIAALKNKLRQTARSIAAMSDSDAARRLRKYETIYAKMRGGASIELLVREKTLERTLVLADLQSDFIIAYLDLLSATGALVASPLKNYLSKNLELL